jgi:hypothetical protein
MTLRPTGPERLAQLPVLGLLLTMGIVGCSDPFTPGEYRFPTRGETSWLLDHYAETAACLELPDEGLLVRWHIAPTLQVDGREVGGAQRGDEIWLSESVMRYESVAVVRHEAMHHILWHATGDGDGAHSHPAWAMCT